MSARDSVLSRLRATAIPEKPSLPDVAGWYATHQRDEDLPQRVARLRAALEASHAQVHDTSPTGWHALLAGLVMDKGLRKLLVGAGTPHGAALQAHGVPGTQIVQYQDSIDAWRDALFDDMDAALTTARSAIAETGSLVLWPSASEPRLMSLVPPVHFVLLDVETIHSDFYSAMTAEGWANGLPTNALLISGPSKTADIQQTLAYGAHGPRELVVLLCHPAGEST
jgi:L-lactate dehydrogenase complex protein LldG